MNEEQRAELMAIAALVDAFVAEPTQRALDTILTRLRRLIRDVQVRAGGIEKLDDGTLKAIGYDGIELTGLRMISAMLRRELRVLFAPPAVPPRAVPGRNEIAAVCAEQAGAMRLLAQRVPPVNFGNPRQGFPGVPFTTLARHACVIDLGTNKLYLSTEPHVRIDLYGFTASIVQLRTLGVTFLGLTGIADLPPQEQSWLCGAAIRLFVEFAYTVPQLCCNVEIAAGDRKLYLRLVLTEDRALFLTCESRIALRARPTGATLQVLKESLRRTYQLRAVSEQGAVWTVEELLEIQAAFAKIPLADRGALVDLELVRSGSSQIDRPDAAQHRGYYDTVNHSFTILNGAFADLNGFVGSGDDAVPYSHFVILHEIGHVVENWYRVPGGQDGGALALFGAQVEALQVQPFTIYAWHNWAAKPIEFFADAYSYFLNDPGAMEYVSHQLLTWFRQGGYRITRGGTRLAMTGLAGPLQTLLGALDGLCNALTAVRSTDQKAVDSLRVSASTLITQLRALFDTLTGYWDARIERAVLWWVAELFKSEATPRLSPPGGGLPAPTVFAELKAIFLRERETLATLLAVVVTPPVRTLRRVSSGACTILMLPDGVTVVRGRRGGDRVMRSLPRAVAALRELGFTGVTLHDSTGGISFWEYTWLYNAAATVFTDCDSQFALAVNVSVAVPSRDRPLLVRFTFFANRSLWIECENVAPALAVPPSVETSTQLLRDRYKVKAVTTAGGCAWTAGELVQVCDAFTKLPAADRRVLQNCTLVRGNGATLGKGTYEAATHTLTFSDATFTSLTEGFHGRSGAVAPPSHWNVLRLVGQAAAMHNWAWDDEPPLTVSLCLGPFTTAATHLGLGASITLLAPDAQPQWIEFFADAYALNLCEPYLLAWISPGLQSWFATGVYRQYVG